MTSLWFNMQVNTISRLIILFFPYSFHTFGIIYNLIQTLLALLLLNICETSCSLNKTRGQKNHMIEINLRFQYLTLKSR